MNAKKMSASNRMDDLNFFEVISFFMPALFRAGFVAIALAIPIVLLIEAARDRPVTILVAAIPTGFALRGFHRLGWD